MLHSELIMMEKAKQTDKIFASFSGKLKVASGSKFMNGVVAINAFTKEI